MKQIIMVVFAACLLVGLVVVVGFSGYGQTDGTSGSKCVKCGSRNVIPIEYGLPGAELCRKAERGEVLLGG